MKNIFKGILRKYNLKKAAEKPVVKVVANKIPTISNAVISIINNLKSENIVIHETSRPVCEDDIYITFLDYIKENRKGTKLPKGQQIETALGISTFKRKELAKQAFNDKILTKGINGYYIYNEFIE